MRPYFLAPQTKLQIVNTALKSLAFRSWTLELPFHIRAPMARYADEPDIDEIHPGTSPVMRSWRKESEPWLSS